MRSFTDHLRETSDPVFIDAEKSLEHAKALLAEAAGRMTQGDDLTLRYKIEEFVTNN